MQQGQRLLTICWMVRIFLQPFSSFAKQGLHVYTLPPPLSSSDGLMESAAKKKKMGSRLVERRKPSVGTHGQEQQMVHSLVYTCYLPK